VREIRTLRAMWRALETGLRQYLNGHEEGNLGYKPRSSLRAAAPALDPTCARLSTVYGGPRVGACPPFFPIPVLHRAVYAFHLRRRTKNR